MKDLKNIMKYKKMHSINIKCNKVLPKCVVYLMGKLARVSFSCSTITSLNALELIHTDICGPMRVPSLSRSRYFATFVDDKTRYCEVAFMAQKSEIFYKFSV